MADIDRHIAQLLNAREVAEVITQALYLGGRKIEQHAELSITRGSVSGAHHVPSAPGEPPNRDSGVLDGNIETRIVAEGAAPEVHVESKAPYAAPLEFGARNRAAVGPFQSAVDREFGTVRMAARPYMAPAARAKSGEVAEIVKAAVSIEIKRHMNG